ncbi:MAG: biotin--[acetyl-CoA-carboxylase] ligase [Actinomycetota bacterium]
MTQHSVAEAARAVRIPAPARFVRETDSTNSDLLRLAMNGAPAWTVLVAGHQTAGRGRLGRTWISEPGSSLLLSVLLRPALPPADAPLLSLGAALAVATACADVADAPVRCKWPNDLVVRERKVGGILPEAAVAGGRLEHVVIGIGTNVLQRAEDFPPELRDTATSLAQEGRAPTLADLLEAVLRSLRGELGGAGEVRPDLLARYRDRCVTLGRRVRATLSGDVHVEGMAVGVGRGGELLVETAQGPRPVAFGEVVHLD